MNNELSDSELTSLEGTRGQFSVRPGAIKLGIDVHQSFYVVVCQEGGTNPKPAQRFTPAAFLSWAAKLRGKHDPATPIHAVYEACGFGFGLQRSLSALGIACHVVCPQKLDERNQRVKTDGRDAKALCQKLDRFVEGNRDALAVALESSKVGRSRLFLVLGVLDSFASPWAETLNLEIRERERDWVGS